MQCSWAELRTQSPYSLWMRAGCLQSSENSTLQCATATPHTSARLRNAHLNCRGAIQPPFRIAKGHSPRPAHSTLAGHLIRLPQCVWLRRCIAVAAQRNQRHMARPAGSLPLEAPALVPVPLLAAAPPAGGLPLQAFLPGIPAPAGLPAARPAPSRAAAPRRCSSCCCRGADCACRGSAVYGLVVVPGSSCILESLELLLTQGQLAVEGLEGHLQEVRQQRLQLWPPTDMGDTRGVQQATVSCNQSGAC